MRKSVEFQCNTESLQLNIITHFACVTCSMVFGMISGHGPFRTVISTHQSVLGMIPFSFTLQAYIAPPYIIDWWCWIAMMPPKTTPLEESVSHSTR